MRVWSALCKNCKKVSAVRDSTAGGNRIEFPDPYKVTAAICPHCGHQNEFSDAELTEMNAEIQWESEGLPIYRPGIPSDKKP